MADGGHTPPLSPDTGYRSDIFVSDSDESDGQSIHSAVEEHEKLLTTDASVSDGQPVKPRHRQRLGWWHPCTFTVSAVTGFAVLLVLLKVALFDSPPIYGPNSAEATAFRRPGSEYILDGSWNFDSPPTVREYNWVIKDIEANPDGVYRPMIMINRKYPGELIRCNEGDTIVVDVDNQSVNATSFHWHGIFQNGSNWMDGPAGVTQCPIAPGRKFRYQFKITGQAGTYFYHGHQAGQAADGLVGPLIVHSKHEKQMQKIPYITDRVVMLQDWYHELSSSLLKEKLSPGNEGAPEPDGALINGANKIDCSVHSDHRCDNSSAVIPSFNLAPNAHHRLRLLNVGAFSWFEVTVDRHHTLLVTEIDGITIEPSPEPSIMIAPGQRYSVVLETNQTDADAFWLRARIMTHCFGENVAPEKGAIEVKAAIRYTEDATGPKDADQPLPMTENDSGIFSVDCLDMKPKAYTPFPKKSAPEHAHHSYYLRVNIEIGDWRLERGFLNQSSYRPNLGSPTLHRVVNGLQAKNDSFQREGVSDKAFDVGRELTISHKEVEVVDIILQNFDEGNHPFHLHGHQMFILGSGHGYFPGYEAIGLAPEGKGLSKPSNSSIIDNPIRRDVATVETFGWTLIRFVADNPGIWLFHCHVLWHSESGMAMQFVSRSDVLENWTLPSENLELCNAGINELEKGAPPKDSTWFGQIG